MSDRRCWISTGRCPRVCARRSPRALGGVSAAPWDSFNLATHVGDDPRDVAANRARLRELLALPAEPVWLNQVHGTDVADLDARRSGRCHRRRMPPSRTRPAASAWSWWPTACPCCSRTRDGRRVGAAHAGWRGLAAGVLEQHRERAGSARRANSRPGWARRSRASTSKWATKCALRSWRADAGAVDCFERERARTLAGGSRRARAPAARGARRHRRQRRAVVHVRGPRAVLFASARRARAAAWRR